MNFGTIILDQSMDTRKHYAKQIVTALLFTLKLKIFFEDNFNDVEKIRLTIIKKIKYLFQ